MKKLILFFALFLSFESYANDQCFAMLRKADAGVLEILYKGNEQQVKVKIRNTEGDVLYSETLQKRGSFIRPYNLSSLPDGRYSFSLKGELSSHYFEVEKSEGRISVNRVMSISLRKEESDSYKLTVLGNMQQIVSVQFKDREDRIIFSERIRENGSFEKSYRFKERAEGQRISVEHEYLSFSGKLK